MVIFEFYKLIFWHFIKIVKPYRDAIYDPRRSEETSLILLAPRRFGVRGVASLGEMSPLYDRFLSGVF